MLLLRNIQYSPLIHKILRMQKALSTVFMVNHFFMVNYNLNLSTLSYLEIPSMNFFSFRIYRKFDYFSLSLYLIKKNFIRQIFYRSFFLFYVSFTLFILHLSFMNHSTIQIWIYTVISVISFT